MSLSQQFLSGVIQLPGMRKLWDARFVEGFQIARYTRTSYCFYSEMKGMGWLVYPRDIVGIQKNYGGETDNGERTVIQTSVEESELAAEQKGKTRATLKVSGWKLVWVLTSSCSYGGSDVLMNRDFAVPKATIWELLTSSISLSTVLSLTQW